jgi:hypothetical protein
MSRKNKTAPLESFSDGAQEFVVPERLGKEFNSACLHGFDSSWYVVGSAEKNGWDVRTFFGCTLLQFEPA